MVVAWANFVAQRAYGSVDDKGTVDTSELDDENITDRSGGGDYSKGIIILEFGKNTVREGENDVVNYTPRRLFLKGIPEELKRDLRSFPTIADARMNVVVRVFNAGNRIPSSTFFIAPDGSWEHTDFATGGSTRDDVDDIVTAARQWPMRYLQ
jgi:hypothetical protein